MSQRNRQLPKNWDAYERGRASSFGSLESVPEGQQQEYSTSATSEARDVPGLQPPHADREHGLRHRKSSIAVRFDSIRRMGGVNSIDNFARSFQRAAAYNQITPVRRGSVSLHGDEEEDDIGGEEESTPTQGQSLLGQQIQAAGPDGLPSQEQGQQSNANETSSLLPTASHRSHRSSNHDSAGRFGTSYGSISSRLTESAQRRASILIHQQHVASVRAMQQGEVYKDEGVRPVEAEVQPDGEVIERVIGQSTVPMTVFNSTNVLIGVGILALPLAVRYSGWVIGLSFLTFAALATSYTARLLARCMDTNTGSTTYGDIAYLAFDHWGRALVEVMFILELTAANVALVILFGDSMNSLLPRLSVIAWKIVISVGLIPLNFVPLKNLSITSVLGVVSCLGIVGIVLVDGLISPHSPGSLRHPAQTHAFPVNWRTVPLSLGLFMAPWGGHSVFPAIYKDMRHPKKYGRAVKYTYIFTYGLDFSMAVLGYLMFGDFTRDEITSNILLSTAYPTALSVLVVILIAIIPITKVPLSNRPIMDTLNKKFYIDLRQMDPKARVHSEASLKHRIGRGTVAIVCNLVQLAVSIAFPSFDSIMALMGSVLCFTICIILPVAFYLKIFSTEGNVIALKERVFDWFLIIFCTALGVLGTVFAILPKDEIRAH